MKIALAQLNPIVGNLNYNFNKIIYALQKAYSLKTDLIIFSELYLTGYPPLDLLENPWFIKKIYSYIEKIKKISKHFPEIAILIGTPLISNKNFGKHLTNSAIVIKNGNIIFQQNKTLLPTYDVFDEARYFEPADTIDVLELNNKKFGITICEDAWIDFKNVFNNNLYKINPVNILINKGADIIINISASPYYYGKFEDRSNNFLKLRKLYNKDIIYVNQIGVNDELIFDGTSFVLSAKENSSFYLPSFKESISIFNFQKNEIIFETNYELDKFYFNDDPFYKNFNHSENDLQYDLDSINKLKESNLFIEKNNSIKKININNNQNYFITDNLSQLHDSLIFGIKDYLKKSKYSNNVCFGLSGGIDSALVAYLATKALGKENIHPIAMPSMFSSKSSVEDSLKLSENLGLHLTIIPIKEVYDSYMTALKNSFKGKKFDLTEENIQARIRGNVVMAFSNKFNYFVLATGNKSEISVGYCTLYGDMAGGLSPIGDLYKTQVYNLANFINREKEIIPEQIIKKPPSAELRPGQKDQDSLPEYEELDNILKLHLENGKGKEEIINMGFSKETVNFVLKKIYQNEYKRKQASIVLKITKKAFGRGRIYPINGQIEI